MYISPGFHLPQYQEGFSGVVASSESLLGQKHPDARLKFNSVKWTETLLGHGKICLKRYIKVIVDTMSAKLMGVSLSLGIFCPGGFMSYIYFLLYDHVKSISSCLLNINFIILSMS